jgi:hypothetical protein
MIDEVPSNADTTEAGRAGWLLLRRPPLDRRDHARPGAGRLVLAHLWPGTDPQAARLPPGIPTPGISGLPEKGSSWTCRLAMGDRV